MNSKTQMLQEIRTIRCPDDHIHICAAQRSKIESTFISKSSPEIDVGWDTSRSIEESVSSIDAASHLSEDRLKKQVLRSGSLSHCVTKIIHSGNLLWFCDHDQADGDSEEKQHSGECSVPDSERDTSMLLRGPDRKVTFHLLTIKAVGNCCSFRVRNSDSTL